MTERIQIIHADSRDALREIATSSLDSCATDPPYALVSIAKRFGGNNAAPAKSEGATGVYARASAGFMGQKWDTGETAFDPAFWREVWRVLKPGAHLVAFGGTRTYHRLAVAIEDAGFEIRDMVAWLYGSGFPKSHDVSKGIDKAAGAAREVVAEGAAVKRMIPGADQHKNGWEKNDGRVFVPTVTKPATAEAEAWEGWGTALKPALEPLVLARKPIDGTVAANVLRHGTGALNIDACRLPPSGAGDYDYAPGDHGIKGRVRQSGFALSAGRLNPIGRWPANVAHDGSAEALADFPGGAARFFYSAKAGEDDRLGSKHPTVKPVDLMAWLLRLVTPPGGTVLDPFAGSGTTGMAALREGFDAVLIEREAAFVADIRRRVAHVAGTDLPLFGGDLADTPPGGVAESTASSLTNDHRAAREVMA